MQASVSYPDSVPVEPTIRDLVLANAQQHATLLASLSSLSSSPASLASHESYIEELTEQLARVTKQIRQFEVKTWAAQREYDSIKDDLGRTKRFMAGLVGMKDKVDERLLIEERKYQRALEEEKSAKERKRAIERLIAAATIEKEELEANVREYRTRRARLGSLYSTIFDGPTPDYPEEDRLEYDFLESQKRYDEASHQLSIELEVAEHLEMASASMKASLSELKTLVSRWTADVATRSKTLTDNLKRKGLGDAIRHYTEARALVDKAVAVSPNVIQPLNPPLIGGQTIEAEPDIPAAVFKDSSFLLPTFRDFEASNTKLRSQLDSASRRRNNLVGIMNEVSPQLEQRREALFDLRQSIFVSFLPAGVDDGASPPDYHSVIQS
ncbi:hypothetical protein CC1G_09660 [Coprinopsis cinerea okayama7|uniref:Uncharacterized protein n=1 Tax=Coprinopsis cinerea (strain Okayama-7 / 130 / ATCC MYA-4618 / FGSC 9003) TaxID=240176 RepID=A8P9E8_COPC7|nr:hypothetical protein CC1G_09660 [Coprinopsis cinerea okayama7\|eukprot:XP_001839757.2 hypothetical protein CC1G_09660 [Coprinopsis cinerea okayama7\